MPKSNNNGNISSQRQCAANTIDEFYYTRSVYWDRPAAVAAILHKILMKFLCDDDIFALLDFFTLSLVLVQPFAPFIREVKYPAEGVARRHRGNGRMFSKYQQNMTIDG